MTELLELNSVNGSHNGDHHHNLLVEFMEHLPLFLKEHNHKHRSERACTNDPEIKQEDGDLKHAGIAKAITDKGEETRYPNGVVVTRTNDGGMEVQGPPGSTLEVYDNQTSIIRDASGRRIAVMDRNNNIYVTANGKTFYQGNDGDVFSADANDCQRRQIINEATPARLIHIECEKVERP